MIKAFSFLLACSALFCSPQSLGTQITALPENSTPTPVSDDLFASFIELGFGRSDLLWGEMLFNGDLEYTKPVGERNSWVAYTRPSKEEEDWWHSGYEEDKANWYTVRDGKKDPSLGAFRAFPGYWPSGHGKYFADLNNKKSQTPLFLAQDKIYLRKGVSYNFSALINNGVFMSGDKEGKDPVTVTLVSFKEGDFSQVISSTKITIKDNTFTTYTATLDAGDYEGWATFAVEVPPGKQIGMDMLSLHAADDVKGWRKDAVDLLKNEAKPRTIRFPGGCFASFYDWRHGVGKPEDRPVTYDTFWNCEVVNDIGTAEYIDFCRAIDAEPFICVPVMFRDQFNAADWVDFCNNPDNTQRIAYGYKEPFNVKYWELDNENYRRFDAITYAKRCVEFAKEMKKRDPSIKLIMANYWSFNPKFSEMLEIAGPYIDGVTNRGGSVEEMRKDIDILNAYNKKHDKNIFLCHTEFRAPLSKAEAGGVDGLNVVNNSEKESLLNRCCRWEYAMSCLDQYVHYQNMGDIFFTAQFTNLSDGWGENIINNANERAYLSAVGVMFQLMHKLNIHQPQKLDVDTPDKLLVTQAGWNKDHSAFTVLLLNFKEEAVPVSLNLSELKAKFGEKATVYEIAPNSRLDFNTPAEPDKVKLESRTIDSSSLDNVTIKPYSVYAVTVPVER